MYQKSKSWVVHVKNGIEVEPRTKEIKAKFNVKMNIQLPQTNIFDNTFGASFN